jgi:hypothetical protein
MKKNNIFEIVKQGLISVFPFIAVGIYNKNKTGFTWKGIVIGVLSGLLWFILVFSYPSIDTSDLENEIFENENQIFHLNQMLESKESDILRLEDQIEEITPETTAQNAYKLLNTDNLINEPYDLIIDMVLEIDINVIPSTPKDIGIFGDKSQIFEFSDGSKIKLYKDSANIFLPYNTEIIN